MKMTCKTRLQLLEAHKLLTALINDHIYRDIDYSLVVEIDKIIDCLEHAKSEVVNNYGEK